MKWTLRMGAGTLLIFLIIISFFTGHIIDTGILIFDILIMAIGAFLIYSSLRDEEKEKNNKK